MSYSLQDILIHSAFVSLAPWLYHRRFCIGSCLSSPPPLSPIWLDVGLYTFSFRYHPVFSNSFGSIDQDLRALSVSLIGEKCSCDPQRPTCPHSVNLSLSPRLPGLSSIVSIFQPTRTACFRNSRIGIIPLSIIYHLVCFPSPHKGWTCTKMMTRLNCQTPIGRRTSTYPPYLAIGYHLSDSPLTPYLLPLRLNSLCAIHSLTSCVVPFGSWTSIISS
jgi:hypothetical protein